MFSGLSLLRKPPGCMSLRYSWPLNISQMSSFFRKSLSNLYPSNLMNSASVLNKIHKSYHTVIIMIICKCKTRVLIKLYISKSDERKAWGRFEIMSTIIITPWIVRHQVQRLINHIYLINFGIVKMFFGKFFWAKTSVGWCAFHNIIVENCETLQKSH